LERRWVEISQRHGAIKNNVLDEKEEREFLAVLFVHDAR